MFRLFSFLLLSSFFLEISCNKTFISTHHQYERIEINENQGKELAVEQLIKPYQNKLSEEMNLVIARTSQKLVKGKPESALGNMVADIILAKSSDYYHEPVDFSIVNYGGIRVPYLPEGDITVGNIFELMPFDNMLLILSIDGKTVKEVLDISASRGGWPIAGASYQIKEDKAIDIKISGIPLDAQKMYSMAVSDYLADGGDNLNMLINAKRYETAVLFRDALLEFLKESGQNGGSITANIEGRVIYEQ